jgi:hypothetical protein
MGPGGAASLRNAVCCCSLAVVVAVDKRAVSGWVALPLSLEQGRWEVRVGSLAGGVGTKPETPVGAPGGQGQ